MSKVIFNLFIVKLHSFVSMNLIILNQNCCAVRLFAKECQSEIWKMIVIWLTLCWSQDQGTAVRAPKCPSSSKEALPAGQNSSTGTMSGAVEIYPSWELPHTTHAPLPCAIQPLQALSQNVQTSHPPRLLHGHWLQERPSATTLNHRRRLLTEISESHSALSVSTSCKSVPGYAVGLKQNGLQTLYNLGANLCHFFQNMWKSTYTVTAFSLSRLQGGLLVLLFSCHDLLRSGGAY